MKISIDKKNGLSVLKVDGRVDATNFMEMEAEVTRLFDEEEVSLVIDCSGLSYISSSGLRVFLIAQKKAMATNGKLFLCCLQPLIKGIFDISGFTSIFKIYGTLDEVISH
ncbi:MAG: STAS domain-containing protein [Macellibacteroides fermentans]|uniref:STAS domain-containing protein n=1 Tax=Macellibacteroides fermentans TaxID=879969 RepID=UPI003B7119C0